MRAIYRAQGDRLYKIKGDELIEINLASYDYGVIGIAYAKKSTSPLWPNKYATPIRKAEFEKFYKEAISKIKKVAK
jgi:hypothetical protein